MGLLQAGAVKYWQAVSRVVIVKSESAASIATVCPGSNTVLATVIIVVKYRLIYQLMVNYRQQRPVQVVVGGHLARAAKALIVSKLITIFYPRDRKS